MASERRKTGTKLSREEFDFAGMDLTGAKLDGAELPGSRFDGATHVRADLLGANLASCSFANADLTDAILSKANLDYATLDGALLVNAKLFRAELHRASFAGTDLTNADLRRVFAGDARLDGAIFDNTQLELDDLRNAIMGDAIVRSIRYAPHMRLEKRQDANGFYYVRPPFSADAYRVTANAMRGITSWKNDHMPTKALLEMRDGPFAGWQRVSQFERDGKQWVRFYNTSGEYGVDVELVDAGLGEVVELDPKLAYDMAVENDRKRTDARVVQE